MRLESFSGVMIRETTQMRWRNCVQIMQVSYIFWTEPTGYTSNGCLTSQIQSMAYIANQRIKIDLME